MPHSGGGDFCSVNVAVLDIKPAVIDTILVRYFDGLHNNWMSRRRTRHTCSDHCSPSFYAPV